MDLEERQRGILALLSQESGISAGGLARHFSVSRMTIHRDLSLLQHQGLLLRIHGGAVAKGGKGDVDTKYCSGCSRPVLPHQQGEFLPTVAEILIACCACCCLRQFMRRGATGSVAVRDFISGRVQRGEEAFFVINSLAVPCCQPSLLSFADENSAQLFQSGFGGSIARMSDALEFLRISEGLSGEF